MKPNEIDRINELARKSKAEGLTEAEKAEQKVLRDAYIAGFRQSLQSQLDNTRVINPDGTSFKLKQKKGAD